MYKCENCQTIVPHRTKAHRIAIKTRRKRYPFREYANQFKRKGNIQHSDDYGGIGYETVREITVCPDCAIQLGS